MKITFLLVALCLAISLGSAFTIRSNKKHVLINRPKIDVFGARDKRTVSAGVKGGRPAPVPRPVALESRVRKGEYVCDNKICKLQPGVEPKGCNGVCQYPVRY